MAGEPDGTGAARDGRGGRLAAADPLGRACLRGRVKKFGDDNANLLVVALAWYGFTAIFPLLLVVVTVFGFIGAAVDRAPASSARCTSSR